GRSMCRPARGSWREHGSGGQRDDRGDRGSCRATPELPGEIDMKLTEGGQKLRIGFVDLSGESSTAYTPLGVMLLKAALEEDGHLRDRVSVTVHSFLAGTSIAAMAAEITRTDPQVLGLSCQGWNIAVYGQLLPTLCQLLPNTLVILGGNHVSHY